MKTAEQIERLVKNTTKLNPNSTLEEYLLRSAISAWSWTTLTNMTMVLGGPAAKGNKKTVEDVRTLAQLGVLEVTRKGRVQTFRATNELLAWAKHNPKYSSVQMLMTENRYAVEDTF